MLVFFHSFLNPSVYILMLNFVTIAKQLDCEALPILYDKEVFRIPVNIYLQK